VPIMTQNSLMDGRRLLLEPSQEDLDLGALDQPTAGLLGRRARIDLRLMVAQPTHHRRSEGSNYSGNPHSFPLSDWTDADTPGSSVGFEE
jgi:hypothetical protein